MVYEIFDVYGVVRHIEHMFHEISLPPELIREASNFSFSCGCCLWSLCSLRCLWEETVYQLAGTENRFCIVRIRDWHVITQPQSDSSCQDIHFSYRNPRSVTDSPKIFLLSNVIFLYMLLLTRIHATANYNKHHNLANQLQNLIQFNQLIIIRIWNSSISHTVKHYLTDQYQ